MTAQESPVLRQTGVATTAAIVGFQQDPALESLLTMLRSRKGVQIIGEFETLREAAVAGLGRTQIPDLVVVLQSYSDEFAQEEVNDLVGLMLCGRVLCCYGPWCISDDRSHAIWPIANRVPANSAEIVIGLELAEIARGAWPLSPLAAGEEVFAHRTRLLPGIESAACANGLVLVVSDDLALRDTAALICRARGLPVETVGTEFHAIFETVQKSSSTLRSVLIDLDPVLEHMKDLRAAVKGAAPGAEVIGMTVFAESPDAGCRRDSRTEILGLQQAIGCELRAVIDKTELVTQLQCLVNVR